VEQERKDVAYALFSAKELKADARDLGSTKADGYLLDVVKVDDDRRQRRNELFAAPAAEVFQETAVGLKWASEAATERKKETRPTGGRQETLVNFMMKQQDGSLCC
jgi:hypothetical protein